MLIIDSDELGLQQHQNAREALEKALKSLIEYKDEYKHFETLHKIIDYTQLMIDASDLKITFDENAEAIIKQTESMISQTVVISNLTKNAMEFKKSSVL